MAGLDHPIISGMHCAGCVGKVEAVLGELPGVMRVAVSLEPGLARVDFDAAPRDWANYVPLVSLAYSAVLLPVVVRKAAPHVDTDVAAVAGLLFATATSKPRPL